MITAKVREEVLWSGPCAYCGDLCPTQVDHVIPRSRGGTDARENLAPSCASCNFEKLDFTPEEYRAYREEHGLGWPPKPRAVRLLETISEAAARYGKSEKEMREIFLCGLMRERSFERAAEWEAAEQAPIKALVIEQARLEERIERGAAYAWLLPERLAKINAQLAELLA